MRERIRGGKRKVEVGRGGQIGFAFFSYLKIIR